MLKQHTRRKGGAPSSLLGQTEATSVPSKATAIVASAVILIVMIGTVLVVAPAGTPLRSEVRQAALPYFGQNWRVFAPGILKTNRSLEFRAQWRGDDGELVKSGWIDITGIEQRTVEGNFTPSRIQKSSWNASSTYLTRYGTLSTEQKKRVRDTFIEAHDGGFRPIPVDDLIADLGEKDADVIRFLRMDYMLMRYVTQYARAGFDREIERVQWRIVRERPNDFLHRFDERPQFTTNTTTFGWRQSNVRMDDAVVSQYRALIARAGADIAFEEAARDAE